MAGPSPIWQWIGLLAGVISLPIAIVSLPSILQFFCGPPRITIEFGDSHRDGLKILRAYIENQQVPRWMRRLGVARQPAHIFADYRVTESGSGKVVVPCVRPRINVENGGEPALRVELASGLPGLCAILAMNDQNAAGFIDDDGSISVLPGEYVVEFNVYTSEWKKESASKTLVVGANQAKTFWS
jgi:hypothetical protein